MRTTLAMGIALALGLCSNVAAAQSRGYSANRFDPSEPGSDWFATESLDLRGPLLPRAGAVFDWAYRPLRAPSPEGEGARHVLVDQLFVHTRLDLVLADRLRVGLGAPIAIYQDGDAPRPPSVSPGPPARAQALGDLRLAADTRLFGTYKDVVRGAIGVVLHLPTGSRASFSGDGLLRVAPRFMLAGTVKVFDWAAKVGLLYRPHPRIWEGRSLGDDVTFALSAGVKVNDRFVLGPELHGAATVTGPDALGPRSVPIELLLGGRVRIASHFQAGSAIGGAMTTADGAPRMRVLAMFEYAPDVCVDKDGDGICAPDDACPEVDGVRTNDRHTNGCPFDRDHDGVPDRNDNCPDEVGGPAMDPEGVGCPDRDNDGVVDKLDACPDVPGLRSTDPAQNGCPELVEPPPEAPDR